MRSAVPQPGVPEPTGTEAILRAATEQFAAEGTERVTIRSIAAAAEVSPALVIHHFGSRAGLRAAVEQRVVERFSDVIAGFESSDKTGDNASIGALIADVTDDEPALFAYVRRLLIEGGPAADALFTTLFAMTRRVTRNLSEAGLTTPTDDEDTRAAFLLVNDLAVLLLRDRIATAIGADPLTGTGLARWIDQVMAVYTHGFYRPPEPPPETGATR